MQGGVRQENHRIPLPGGGCRDPGLCRDTFGSELPASQFSCLKPGASELQSLGNAQLPTNVSVKKIFLQSGIFSTNQELCAQQEQRSPIPRESWDIWISGIFKLLWSSWNGKSHPRGWVTSVPAKPWGAKNTQKMPQTHLLLTEVATWALQTKQTKGQQLWELFQEILGFFGHCQRRVEVGMFDFVQVLLEQGLPSLAVAFWELCQEGIQGARPALHALKWWTSHLQEHQVSGHGAKLSLRCKKLSQKLKILVRWSATSGIKYSRMKMGPLPLVP